MGRVEGRVALVTGAARGQGRAHALRLAEEGAAIVALDLAGQIGTVPAPMATAEDLADTVRAVEAAGGLILARHADVRDQAALDAVVAEGRDAFGAPDIIVANAGIYLLGTAWELREAEWCDVIDVNLTGVWHTVKAAVPSMIAAGRGGAIVLTGSTAALKGLPSLSAYSAAKHGLVGLMRSLAIELGRHRIRVNCVHPGAVATPMVVNDWQIRLARPDLEAPTLADMEAGTEAANLLPVGLIDPADIANAVLWLVSDEARCVTGASIPVDAGFTVHQ
jgi:(+)-trans-carveol dehydrogenase